MYSSGKKPLKAGMNRTIKAEKHWEATRAAKVINSEGVKGLLDTLVNTP